MQCNYVTRIEYLIWQCNTSHISTSPKRKLRNNTDVIDYFAVDNEIHEYRPKSAAVKDIDIDISKGDINGYRLTCSKDDW